MKPIIKVQPKQPPKAHAPAAKREALLAASKGFGSMSKSAARLARQFDSGAGIVAR